jgi:HK97 family phage major capsid protein
MSSVTSSYGQLLEARAILDTARAEGRAPTESELNQVKAAADRAERLEVKARVDAVGESIGAPISPYDSGGGIGGQFVQSKGYQAIKNASARGQSWTTGPVEVPGAMYKGTLLEGSGAPGSGTGGGLIPVPQVVPGVVSKLSQPLYLESLLSSGQALNNTVRYAVEGTATSGAQGVAEGGTKPESTLAFSTVDEPVKKIATSISISDELLDDAPAVQAFINGELVRFVNIEVERQLLRGAAGGNEVQGLLTSRNVPVYTAGTAQGNIAEQLFKAANSMRGSAFLEPEWVVVHPDDYQKLRLLKDNSGQLYFGGPNTGTYGVGQGAAASPQITGAPDVLWGKPTYVTPIVGSGTALIGTRQGAQVWTRGGAVVEASNSHASYFTSDLVAIRCERRLALTLYRANGFVEVRGLA